jgi:PAS domain S-box-containing protein
MQNLEHLTEEELRALVQTLERRIARLEAEAEIALRRSAMASVAESSHDAIISYGLDGTILSWNRGAEEMFGYAPTEVIGQSYHLLVPSEFPDQMRARCARIERGDRVAPFETTARRKDGTHAGDRTRGRLGGRLPLRAFVLDR